MKQSIFNMDYLPEDPILKFHTNTLVAVRKLYKLEKQEDVNEIINLLDEWVKKQNHFTKKDFSKTYLERSMIMLKGSTERTKNQLDKMCTARTLLPKYFTISNPKAEFDRLNKHFAHALLPTLTKEHYRVYVLKYFDNDFSASNFMSIYKYGILLTEYMKSFDYNDGFVIIFDLRGISVGQMVAKINLVDLREVAVIAMQCYQLRVKGVHILTESKSVNVLLNILKQLVSAKIGGRIQVHKNLETVYEYVPRENLPTELGGNEKSIIDLSNDWINLLSTKENVNYFKEMSEARTDETLRQTDTFNEQYMGMAGTFRRLNVD